MNNKQYIHLKSTFMKRETNENVCRRSSWTSRLTSLIIVFAFALHAIAASANGNITIKKNNISVKDAFASIKQQAKVFVMYENNTIKENQLISLNLTNASLQTVMGDICTKAGLNYEIKGQYVLVTRNNKLIKGGLGNNHVTGRVIDETGEPMIGREALSDTMEDIIVDTAGAFVVSLLGFISLKLGRPLETIRAKKRNTDNAVDAPQDAPVPPSDDRSDE